MSQTDKIDGSFFVRKQIVWLEEKKYDGLKLVAEIRASLRKGTSGVLLLSLIGVEFNEHVGVYISHIDQWILKKLPAENLVRINVEKQHEALKSKLNDLITSVHPTCELAEQFANLLEENIRYEIRVLFPLVKKELSHTDSSFKAH